VNWTPSSWRSLTAAQQPQWPDSAALQDVEQRLAAMPTLVFAGEARNLTADLARVALAKHSFYKPAIAPNRLMLLKLMRFATS